eukprot:TRINITY_DN3201_c0_g1_i1.p1 TRINITY_DN3201_c0_g1~~TRINITY_DN3201_c0_g1_i1.p1  ORF type:complete len:415 (-),score=81.43 TRINITY_DN3201_c0_g1_i1:112-1356(-)
MSQPRNSLDRNKKREYCEILGVPVDANEKVVKKAYHKLALELHPDRPQNRGKEGIDIQFKKVAEAYESLSNGNHTLNSLKNSLKSEDIHSSLEHFFFTTKSHGNSLNNFKFTPLSASDFSTGSGSFPKGLNLQGLDMKFPSLGAAANSGSSIQAKNLHPEMPTTIPPKRGQSLKTTLHITFEEGVKGCTKILEFARSILCQQCNGVGYLNGKQQKPYCRDCNNQGTITTNMANKTVTTPCPTCQFHAQTQDIKERCSSCAGSGKVVTRKNCTVEVPPGALTGSTKVFHGQGDEGSSGGEAGDFIVCFDVQGHTNYRREGDNAHSSVEISFPLAILGTTVDALTIYGHPVEINIHPGTQHGEYVRIPGEGFYNDKNQKGDYLIQVLIRVPTAKLLNKDECDLLTKLAIQPSFKKK